MSSITDRHRYFDKKVKMKKKYVVYTCLAGDYDNLPPIQINNKKIDYICFTDQKINSKNWKMKKLISSPKIKDPFLINRYHKFFAHKFLNNYNFSIYIDSNMKIKKDMINIFNKFERNNYPIAVFKHIKKRTIHSEIEKINKIEKFDNFSKNNISDLKNLYKENKISLSLEIPMTQAIVRNHKFKKFDLPMSVWWTSIHLFVNRDQLTFPFVWKKYLNKLVFLENFNIFYTDFFEKISHKKTFLIRLKTLGKKFA